MMKNMIKKNHFRNRYTIFSVERNILKNDIRRQTYFFRQLFAQIFQHLKKSRIYS